MSTGKNTWFPVDFPSHWNQRNVSCIIKPLVLGHLTGGVDV